MSTCETPFKSLIHKGFRGSSAILWITLLIACHGRRQGLANQGLDWNAHKKSKLQNTYKSTTYGRYWICSRKRPPQPGCCSASIFLCISQDSPTNFTAKPC